MLKSPLRAYRASGIGNCADVIELAFAFGAQILISPRSEQRRNEAANSPDIFALDRQIRNGTYPELALGAGVLARASPSSASSIRLDGGIPLRRRREHWQIPLVNGQLGAL
jgi:hypothetical protein